MEVVVLDRQRGQRIERARLLAFLDRLVQTVPPGGADSLGIKLVSDRGIREYNRVFRSKDAPTDVLSFPAGPEADPDGSRHLGDIVISVPTAAAQARSRGHSLEREIQLLLLHGYLHLLGHDHETDGGTMMDLQRELIRKLWSGSRRRGWR